MHPAEGNSPVYSQLYICEPEHALRERMARNENHECREDIMRQVQQVMRRESPFVDAYKHMAQVEEEEIEKAARENRVPSQVRMNYKNYLFYHHT